MWRVNLSVPLRVDALVSRYLTNKLIRHRLLQGRPKPLILEPFDPRISFGITCTFAKGPKTAAIPKPKVHYLCITHPSATNAYLDYSIKASVRLACLSHAASVHSEPGSNPSSLYCKLPCPVRDKKEFFLELNTFSICTESVEKIKNTIFLA